MHINRLVGAPIWLPPHCGEQLPFPDDHFDCVTSRLCAHHFADPAKAVAESARVLRAGGRLLVSDSMSPEEAALDTFFNTFELLRDASHVRNHRVSEWRAMLQAAGFAFCELGGGLVVQDFEDWVGRMATPPTAVAQLRALFREASDPSREAFAIEAGGDRFGIPIRVVEGRLAEAAHAG